MKCTCWALLGALVICCTAGGQVINIESARLQTDTLGIKGSASLGFSLVSNQVKVVQTDARLQLQYKTPKSLWLLLGHYGFLKGSGTRFIDNSMLHMRYNSKLSKKLRWEVFTQLQQNSITHIRSRFLAGTGPRLKIADTRHLHLYVASAAMYEYEKENTRPFVTHSDLRGSNYISFTILPFAGTEITSTTYYQPLFRQFSDYRIMNQARLKVDAGKHLELVLDWHYLYDRAPAATAPKETYTFTTGIGYKF